MLGLRGHSPMTQFAFNFWHPKYLPSFKNCGQPVKRGQYFGIWTEYLTCQLGCSYTLFLKLGEEHVTGTGFVMSERF